MREVHAAVAVATKYNRATRLKQSLLGIIPHNGQTFQSADHLVKFPENSFCP
jgi:hypothetical protein